MVSQETNWLQAKMKAASPLSTIKEDVLITPV